jgi:uncharacterized membrane protein YeaQ/YmgE (transglycosylase-associated protein family)
VKAKVLEKWIWILIYGGLLCLVAGLAVSQREEGLGLVMVALGGIVAVVGALLIMVRARMKV